MMSTHQEFSVRLIVASIEIPVKRPQFRPELIKGLFNIVGTGFLWLSFSFAPASIASPITGTSGALTVLFSRLFLKEALSGRKYLGIILAFIGVIGIAILRTN